MPFVIGELSTGGIPSRGDFQTAQANTANLFQGTVAFVPTAEYYDTETIYLDETGVYKSVEPALLAGQLASIEIPNPQTDIHIKTGGPGERSE